MATTKTSIILQITPEQKNKLEKAAASRCMALDEYLLALALDAATEDIPTPELITVSETDWEIITQSLENPPEPNEALKAAIQQHQKEYGKW